MRLDFIAHRDDRVRQKQKLIVSPLKYSVTEVAAPTLNDYRNIVGVLQAAVCLCDSPALPQLHIVTSIMKLTLLSRAELFTWWPGGQMCHFHS